MLDIGVCMPFLYPVVYGFKAGSVIIPDGRQHLLGAEEQAGLLWHKEADGHSDAVYAL